MDWITDILRGAQEQFGVDKPSEYWHQQNKKATEDFIKGFREGEEWLRTNDGKEWIENNLAKREDDE